MKFDDRIIEYVRVNRFEMDNYELIDGLKEHGFNITLEQIRALKKNHNLSGGKKTKLFSDVYPKEVYDYVKANCNGVPVKEMIEIVNKKFDKQYTYENFKGWFGRMHFCTGNDTRFKKNRPAMNKGIKLTKEQKEIILRTAFKKGNIPHNTKPILSESMHKDGYVYVKVFEKGKWVKKQNVIWESHYGPVPPGMIITFLDGNSTHCNIENLALISKEENLNLNKNKLRFEDPEATKCGITLTKLRKKIKERSNT